MEGARAPWTAGKYCICVLLEHSWSRCVAAAQSCRLYGCLYHFLRPSMVLRSLLRLLLRAVEEARDWARGAHDRLFCAAEVRHGRGGAGWGDVNRVCRQDCK